MTTPACSTPENTVSQLISTNTYLEAMEEFISKRGDVSVSEGHILGDIAFLEHTHQQFFLESPSEGTKFTDLKL